MSEKTWQWCFTGANGGEHWAVPVNPRNEHHRIGPFAKQTDAHECAERMNAFCASLGYTKELASLTAERDRLAGEVNSAGRLVKPPRPCPAVTDEVVEELAKAYHEAYWNHSHDFLFATASDKKDQRAGIRAVLDRAASLGMLGGEASGECYQTFDCNGGEHADCCPANGSRRERIITECAHAMATADGVGAGWQLGAIQRKYKALATACLDALPKPTPSPPASGPVVLTGGEETELAMRLSEICGFSRAKFDKPDDAHEWYSAWIGRANEFIAAYHAILASRSTGTEGPCEACSEPKETHAPTP